MQPGDAASKQLPADVCRAVLGGRLETPRGESLQQCSSEDWKQQAFARCSIVFGVGNN